MSESARRNYLYGVAAFAIPTVLLVLAIPILIREIGTDGFGLYFFAASLAGTIALADIGIGNATIRFVASDLAAERKDLVAEVIGASFFMYLALGALGAMALYLLAPVLARAYSGSNIPISEGQSVFRIIAFQIVPALIVGISISIFKGFRRFDLAAITTSLLAITIYGGAIAASLVTKIDMVELAMIGLAANFVVLCFAMAQSYGLCRKHGIAAGNMWPRRRTYRRLMGFSLYMAINSLSAFCLQHIQKFLIGALLGPGAMATYQVAQTLPGKAHALVNAGAEFLFPQSSAIGDRSALRPTYLRVLGVSLVLSLATLVPLQVFSEPLLTFWLGKDIARDVGMILGPLIVAYFVTSLSPAPFHVVNGLNRPGLNTLSFAVNAALNILLIGVFAIDGLTLMDFAWAFAISNLVSGIAFQVGVEYLIWRRPAQLGAA